MNSRLETSLQLPDVLQKLEALRTEFCDLAFVLETRGRIDAADVAVMAAGRVSELCAELTGESEPNEPAAPRVVTGT